MGIYRVPRLRLIPNGDLYLEDEIRYSISTRVISFSGETPIELRLKTDKEDGSGKINFMETLVSSVFGKSYKIQLIPNSKGELKPYKGCCVSRLRKNSSVPLKNPKYIERMKKNTQLISRKQHFRKELRKLIGQGNIKRGMFNDNMAKYLGLSEI